MSKILYPIFKLPNENDEENEAVPIWIKWWMINNYKKHSWVLSEIITGNPLTLENSVATKFYLPPLPRGNSKQVQYSGKNKFSGDFSQFNSIGGTGSAYGYFKLPDDNQPYTLSLIAKNNFTTTNSTFFGFTNNGGNGDGGTNWAIFGASQGVINKGTIISKTTTDYRYVSIYTNNAQTLQSFMDNFEIQLEQGSTATAYEPYVGGTASPNPDFPQEITNVTGDVEVLVQNKNLNRGLRYGYYDSATGRYIENQNYSCSIKPIKVKENESFIFTLDNVRVASFIYQFDSSGNFISRAYVGANEVYSPENNVAYFHYCFKGGNISEVPLNAKGQIEYSTATPYVEHKEQTFTFPLGTEKMYLGDYLADDGIHHVRGQVTFNGSDDERIEKMFGNIYNGKCLYLLYQVHKQQAGAGLSNAFKETLGMTEFYPEGINFNYSNNAFGLIILSERINNNYTVPELKTWLSTHNVTVEYELATEEITPYTTEQQQAYDEIKQAISYEEQTNISGTSDEAEPLFEVQYYMKNESEGE